MNARILVIDDEEAIRFTFERFLKTEGHVVATAESCREAWTRMNEMSFDLIFADIILGDGTGIDLLREIRRRGLGCPVIMITGYPSMETAAESIRLGAADCILKPINQEALLHATNIALKDETVHEEKERYRRSSGSLPLNRAPDPEQNSGTRWTPRAVRDPHERPQTHRVSLCSADQ
jgi:two-component system, NtrC family, response regulator HydG